MLFVIENGTISSTTTFTQTNTSLGSISPCNEPYIYDNTKITMVMNSNWYLWDLSTNDLEVLDSQIIRRNI